MKLPEEIKGYNRLRDLEICRLYIEGKTPKEIANEDFELSERRIQQVLSENHIFVSKHIAWPKSKRIHNLQRLAQEYLDKPLNEKKDYLDIAKELRSEIEDHKQPQNQINILSITNINEINKLSEAELIEKARKTLI